MWGDKTPRTLLFGEFYYMATQLAIVKRVMRRLREEIPNSITDNTYSIMVAEFLNDVNEQLQKKHMWSHRLFDVDFPTVASTHTYSLSASGAATTSTPTNEDSILIYDRHKRPMVFEDTVAASRNPLFERSWETMHRQQELSNYIQGQPSVFAIKKKQGGHGWEIRLEPVPDAVYTLTTRWYIPQAAFAVETSVDEDSDLNLPEHILYLGTLMLALNERGEEMGEPGNVIEQRFNNSVDEAVLTDKGPMIRDNQMEFVAD